MIYNESNSMIVCDNDRRSGRVSRKDRGYQQTTTKTFSIAEAYSYSPTTNTY